MDEKDTKHKRKLLEIYEENLRALEIQSAQLGLVEKPLRIINEMNHAKEEVERLQLLLAERVNDLDKGDIKTVNQEIVAIQSDITKSLIDIHNIIERLIDYDKDTNNHMKDILINTDEGIKISYGMIGVLGEYVENNLDLTLKLVAASERNSIVSLAIIFVTILSSIIFGIQTRQLEIFLVLGFLFACIYMFIQYIVVHRLNKKLRSSISSEKIGWDITPKKKDHKE